MIRSKGASLLEFLDFCHARRPISLSQATSFPSTEQQEQKEGRVKKHQATRFPSKKKKEKAKRMREDHRLLGCKQSPCQTGHWVRASRQAGDFVLLSHVCGRGMFVPPGPGNKQKKRMKTCEQLASKSWAKSVVLTVFFFFL